jgi:hypothetical protein
MAGIRRCTSAKARRYKKKNRAKKNRPTNHKKKQSNSPEMPPHRNRAAKTKQSDYLRLF